MGNRGSSTIRRVVHERSYVQLDNAVARDGRLSFRARGLLAYMLSMKDGWAFSAQRIADESPEGVDAIRTAMRELKEHGFIDHVKEREADGRFRTITVVDEQGGLTGPGESGSGVTCTDAPKEQVGPEVDSHAPGNRPSNRKTSKNTKENTAAVASLGEKKSKDATAIAIVQAWWDEQEHKPIEAHTFIAMVKMVGAAIGKGAWTHDAIARALRSRDVLDNLPLTAWRLERALREPQRDQPRNPAARRVEDW